MSKINCQTFNISVHLRSWYSLMFVYTAYVTRTNNTCGTHVNTRVLQRNYTHPSLITAYANYADRAVSYHNYNKNKHD